MSFSSYKYIVFQQIVDNDGKSLRSGNASNPMLFAQAKIKYLDAKQTLQQIRDDPSFNYYPVKGASFYPVKVGIARVPVDYSFLRFKGTFDDLCAFQPQVSVICR